MVIDLQKEQEATLKRPRLKYSLLAKLMFWLMDFIYGNKITLSKIKFLEVLARIPYQAWEIKQYWGLITGYNNTHKRENAEGLIKWAREAQDNEYWHLMVASEKMKQDNVKESWFWYHFVPPIAAFKYTLFSRLLALISIKSAWKFNAMFEDHAEHAFMQFVKDNPQLENEQVESVAVQDGRGPAQGHYPSWADVFRRIGLDERDHMNESLRRCGMEDKVLPYTSDNESGALAGRIHGE